MLSIFGVESVEKQITNKKNDINIWEFKENMLFKQHNNKEESFSMKTEEIIDSTIFPYLAFLKKIEKNQKKDVMVLNKGRYYLAEIEFETKDNKIIFHSDGKAGFVKLDTDKSPKVFEFTDKNGTVVANLENYFCDDKNN